MMRRSAWLLLALATALVADAAPKKRVIISTDMGIGLVGGWRAGVDADDGWAVGMALAEPRLDVRLIATVQGNSYVEPEQIVADRLVRDILRSRVRRARGAAVKLDDPQAAFLGTAQTRDCWNDATQAMENVLKGGRATIAAIGPLTDVGCLVLNAPPAVVNNIDEVIAIMGRSPDEVFSIGPIIGLTDFNVVMDNRALQVLLASKVPVTFLQFKLTSSVLVPQEFVETLKGGNQVQQFFYDGTMPWIASWEHTFKEKGFHPWDSNAIWYAAAPDAFSCVEVNFLLKPCAAGPTDHYNRLGGCAGHSAAQGPSLDREAVQLWLGEGVAASRKVRACTSYRNDEERARFEHEVRAFLGAR